ncbi:hypothetical protein BHU72_14770 [Desulfuribacillus stibiiarsenatis]|uniref:Uncharacterized protein n=1 Tax=Desulfuribacillus stibiiarsenatis TaxID=1390249 RepID=A0A1E5L7U2_9FIRM|nr:hypothetical protein [Desulfuribacillus stibiiarsenatis]OEH86013.1 hypothetical protein BHU72_14770 [Desulfuribacillus stibiiarsenatis]
MNKKIWLLLIPLFVILTGVFYSDINLWRKSVDEPQSMQNDEILLSVDENLDKQLHQAFWDVVNKEDSIPKQIRNKIESVDFGEYRILQVDTSNVFTVDRLIVGDVELVMQNKKSGVFDWITLNMELRDRELVDLRLVETNYLGNFKESVEFNENDEEKVEKFIINLFEQKLPQSKFGYRYRNVMSSPIEYHVLKVEVTAKGLNSCYFTRVVYKDSSDNQYNANFVIREYQEKFLQVEDIKVYQTNVGDK